VSRQSTGCALFCLPYAGGDETAFWAWRGAFAPHVRVFPVGLPAGPSPPDVTRAISGVAGRPYALYGHSMGARLAFEVVRELRRSDAPPPVRLFVGASRPPHLREPLATFADAADAELVEQLVRRVNAPVELRYDAELRDLLLPPLRADLAWLNSYRLQPEQPLDLPVVAVAGAADPDIRPVELLGWARHTTASFRLHTVAGDHMFVRDMGPGGVADLIAAELSAALCGEPALRLPASDEIHVWLAELDQLPLTCAAADELSATEANRASRLRHEADRRRYIGRCVVLRRILTRYGSDVGTAELAIGPGGKPYVCSPAGLNFSLSQSGGTTIVAVTHGHEVGADVERMRPLANFEAFCEGALESAELAEIAAAPEEARLRVALQLWTAKEAVLKATGDGLRVEPASFSFAEQPHGVPWRAAAPPGLAHLVRWRVTHLELPGAVAAIATELAGWRLRFETLTDVPPEPRHLPPPLLRS
jgi:surfactin synthase thioesterase subunit/phosphopantetheinyl transferase